MARAQLLAERAGVCSQYVMLNWIGMGVLDGVTNQCILDSPGLVKLITMLNEHPAIAEWNAAKNTGKLPWF